MNIKFENYKYSPVVRSRRAELLGFSNLSDDIKDDILPLFTLGKWPRSDNIEDSAKKCIESLGDQRPCVLDVTRIDEHRGKHEDQLSCHDLINPENAFSRWRNFIKDLSENGCVIPTVQFHNDANHRELLQQVLHLERDHGKIAFRINTSRSKQLDAVMNGLGVMSDPSNAIVYADVGFLTTENYASSERTLITTINSVRSIDSTVNIVILASSFPSSVVSFGEDGGVIPILERRLFRELGGDQVAIYGDYSSIHPGIGQTAYGYVPRVDYPTPEEWLYCRVKNRDKATGYIEAANQVMNLDAWDPEFDCWGKSEIERVANGNAEKMGSPGNWIAVRVNMHLTRQVNNPPSYFSDDFDEELEEDWAD